VGVGAACLRCAGHYSGVGAHQQGGANGANVCLTTPLQHCGNDGASPDAVTGVSTAAGGRVTAPAAATPHAVTVASPVLSTSEGRRCFGDAPYAVHAIVATGHEKRRMCRTIVIAAVVDLVLIVSVVVGV
jgi:hypothetical protein